MLRLQNRYGIRQENHRLGLPVSDVQFSCPLKNKPVPREKKRGEREGEREKEAAISSPAAGSHRILRYSESRRDFTTYRVLYVHVNLLFVINVIVVKCDK